MMTCPSCGKKPTSYTQFCPNCGHDLEDVTPKDSPAVPDAWPSSSSVVQPNPFTDNHPPAFGRRTVWTSTPGTPALRTIGAALLITLVVLGGSHYGIAAILVGLVFLTLLGLAARAWRR